ncbi:MAG TPA: hypothetical protein VN903_02670 [Polyangia bacterium]|jgi:hypothetical protein|nr:hypothetical protein [Polyangia bacterium]
MLRIGVALGLIISVGVPAVASAQQPGAGPPMPMAMDLAKVPAGSWAEYSMVMGQLPPMKMRLALVNKSATANVVETSIEGGMMAAAGKMVVQMTMGPGTEGAVKKTVMQLGAGDPMEMPAEMQGGKPFTKPTAKGLLGPETIKVAAGSYKTKHYRDKTPQGEKIDYWVSDTVPPFGLVKLELEQKNNPQIQGKMKFELASLGKDAKQVITKPAKPYDQAALMQQMMGAAAGAGGPGAGAGPGAKPGAAPSPPPPPPPAPPKK